MKKIVFLSMVLLLAFQPGNAQQDSKEQTLEILQKQLLVIQEEEKKTLKKQIEDINSLFNNGVIDKKEADRLKLKAAEERTKKIEERQAVLLETIAYLENKNKESSPKIVNGAEIFLDVDSYFSKSDSLRPATSSNKEPLLERSPIVPNTIEGMGFKKLTNPTTLDLVFAVGLNNTVKDGTTWYDIEDEVDYLFYDSRFFEIGLALKTPLTKKNALRLKYGLSYQLNKLAVNGNRYFQEVDGQTALEDTFRFIGESRFKVNNLVVPVHLEFGPTKQRQNENKTYYATRNQFKIGIGGYAGLNLSARQFVQSSYRYGHLRLWGDAYIDGYDINQQIYGVSAYIGIGAFSIYGKYDLNTIFENGTEDEQFVSVGLRLDL